MHLEKRQEVGALFFDFRKVFDCVPYEPLMASTLISSTGFIVTWQSINRVLLSKETSESLNVTSGVPQGSILSPLLYIDDITKLSLSDGTKLILYADDLLLLGVLLTSDLLWSGHVKNAQPNL